MARTPGQGGRRLRAIAGALVALALLTGTARAKRWEEWSPSPLASDSAYAALSSRPADSLTTEEFAWVDVQRDWRAQRMGEQAGAMRGIMSDGFLHVVRAGDSRFARLAAKPFGALTESERAWLITESAAQRAERSGGASAVVGGVVVGALLGAVVAVCAIGYALGHMRLFP